MWRVTSGRSLFLFNIPEIPGASEKKCWQVLPKKVSTLPMPLSTCFTRR
jgi:hypothetical protein